MGKAIKAVGTAIVVAGLVVATGGAAIGLAFGGGMSVVLGAGSSMAFGFTASQIIGAGALLSSVGTALTAQKPTSTAFATEWLASTDQPIPFAFGHIGVAGFIVHKDEYGGHEAYYSVLSCVSGAGPIRSWGVFKGDQKPVTFAGANGMANTSEWSGAMWRGLRLGAQPDTALLAPGGIDGVLPEWGSAYKLSGKALYMLTMAQDSKLTKYTDGEPQVLQELDGLFYWDPRQDSTYPGGLGPCRLNNPATWVWGENGALFALKWALGLWEDPVGRGAPGVGTCVGGIGSAPAAIDIPAFVHAANVADANGWRCAAWPNTKEDKHAVLTNLLQSAGAVPSRLAGRISCISRGAPQPSILTVTARDTAGPIELDAAMPRLSRINTITPSYWSAEHEWELVPAAPVSVPAYVLEDRGKRPRGVDYGYVPSATQAAQLAAYDIVDSREGITGTIPFKPHLRRLRPGDCFVLDEPGFFLDGQKVKCWGRAKDPQTGVIRIRFRSETDAKHPFALGQTGVAPPSPSLSVSDPTLVPAPVAGSWSLIADIFVDGGVSVPALVITGACDNPLADAVIFEFRPVGAAEWAGAGIEASNIGRKEIPGLTNGTAYEAAVSYRVRGVIGMRRVLASVTSGAAALPPGPGARIPSGRSVTYPTSATASSISIVAHDVYVDGQTISIPAGTVSGLAASTLYGVFWRAGTGFEVETSPSPTHMTTGSWILIGDGQATGDGSGGYPGGETPPGGYCPHEEEPLLLANDSRDGPGRTVRAVEARRGQYVWTRHEATGVWGAWPIYAVEVVEDDLVRLLMADGRRPRFSPGHRLGAADMTFTRLQDLDGGEAFDGTEPGVVEAVEPAGRGRVVRIGVTGAQTYIVAGLLSHNLKMLREPIAE